MNEPVNLVVSPARVVNRIAAIHEQINDHLPSCDAWAEVAAEASAEPHRWGRRRPPAGIRRVARAWRPAASAASRSAAAPAAPASDCPVPSLRGSNARSSRSSRSTRPSCLDADPGAASGRGLGSRTRARTRCATSPAISNQIDLGQFDCLFSRAISRISFRAATAGLIVWQ